MAIGGRSTAGSRWSSSSSSWRGVARRGMARPGVARRGRDLLVEFSAVTSKNFGSVACVLPLAESGAKGPSLRWWRRLPSYDFTATHLAVIRKAISGFLLISEPHWPAAAKGNPAAAVGVALRTIKRQGKPSPGFDLVMSALLRCAIEGSATAVLVLAHVLDRMATKDRSCAALAASWRSVKVAGQVRRRLKSA